jgi:DNA-binding MarR family transcriptional regulator
MTTPPPAEAKACSQQTGPSEANSSDQHAPDKISLGVLEELIGFHLRRAQDVTFQAFIRRAGGAELRPGRFTLLALIGQNEGLTPTILSRVAGRDKSTITPALRDLERLGLVRRMAVAGDRRSCTLALTEAGKSVLQELTIHARAHERAIEQLIGRGNRDLLLDILRRLSAMPATEPGPN